MLEEIGLEVSFEANEKYKIVGEEDWLGVVEINFNGDAKALLESKKTEGVCVVVNKTNNDSNVRIFGKGDLTVELLRNEKKYMLWRGKESVRGKMIVGDKLKINDGETTLVEVVVPEHEKVAANENVYIPEKIDETLATRKKVGMVSIVKNIRERFSSLEEKRKIRIGGEGNKKKKIVLGIGCLAIVVLVISVAWGSYTTRKNEKEAEISRVIEPLEKKRAEAESLLGLNSSGARELLKSVRQEIEKRRSEISDVKLLARLDTLEKKVEETGIKISGVINVEPELFFNLGLIRSELVGTRIDFDGKNVFVLDKEKGLVVKISGLDDKQGILVGKGENLGWRDATNLNGIEYMIGEKSFSYTVSDGKKDLDYDGTVSNPIAVGAFGTSVYVLDKGASEIWRYAITGNEIGQRQRWFAAGFEPNLSNAVDMAIDGDIWVVGEDGKIFRFRRGNSERYAFSETPDNFRPVRIAVSKDETGTVAVLDKENKRVVLFSKLDGNFLKQVVADDFGQANDLVFVDEKSLLVLIAGKIVKFGI